MPRFAKLLPMTLYCLLLAYWPVQAEVLDVFSGTLPGAQPNFASAALPELTVDGLLTLDISVDQALAGQSCTVGILDVNETAISYTSVQETSAALSIPLAAGTYAVYISHSLSSAGAFTIQAFFEIANSSATETEINDQLYQADRVDPIDAYSGSIGYRRTAKERDQNDWYVLEVDEDGLLSLELQAAATLDSPAASLHITDSQGESLSTGYIDDAKASARYPVAPGTFYVRLFLGLDSLYGAYTITSTFTPAVAGKASESETNDTRSNADSVNIDETIYGSVGYRRSETVIDLADWFVFQLEKDGLLTLRVESPDTLWSATNYLALLDNQGRVLASSYLASEAVSFSYPLAQGQFYLLASLGQSNFFGFYTITSQLAAACASTTETEPNNTQDQANAASISASGSVGYFTDRNNRDSTDYFVFQATENGGPYTLSFTPADVQLSAACYDVEGETLASVDTSEPAELLLGTPDAGPCYCAVTARDGRYGCYTMAGFPKDETARGPFTPAPGIQQLLLREEPPEE